MTVLDVERKERTPEKGTLPIETNHLHLDESQLQSSGNVLLLEVKILDHDDKGNQIAVDDGTDANSHKEDYDHPKKTPEGIRHEKTRLIVAKRKTQWRKGEEVHVDDIEENEGAMPELSKLFILNQR